MAQKTISLQLCGGGGRVQVPEWNNVNCEIITTWSNNTQADDTSICNVTTRWDNRYSVPQIWYSGQEESWYFFGVGEYSGATLLDHITIDGVVLSPSYYWEDGLADNPNDSSCYVINTDCVPHDREYVIDLVFYFIDGSSLGYDVTVKVG